MNPNVLVNELYALGNWPNVYGNGPIVLDKWACCVRQMGLLCKANGPVVLGKWACCVSQMGLLC